MKCSKCLGEDLGAVGDYRSAKDDVGKVGVVEVFEPFLWKLRKKVLCEGCVAWYKGISSYVVPYTHKTRLFSGGA